MCVITDSCLDSDNIEEIGVFLQHVLNCKKNQNAGKS